jgi:hypothetical protein
MSGRLLLGQATSTSDDNFVEFASHVNLRDLPVALGMSLFHCGEAPSLRLDGQTVSEPLA